MEKKSLHVIPTREGGWSVRSEGALKASRNFTKKSEAVLYARERARSGRSELYVHGQDGMIRERNSYGRNPYPRVR
jgi:hypothetical protein